MTWLAFFADTVTHHKTSTSFRQALQMSGTKRRESGLTAGQRDKRNRHDNALWNLQTAQRIQAEVDAYWNYDYRQFRNPRSWKWI